MLESIASAQHSITLETYIFWCGSIGDEFADALINRADNKVKAHVLLEWAGGDLDGNLIARMRNSGVEIRWYNAPHWYNLHFLNHRTHRKLLVMDGQAALLAV